jgi:hypothetical protein
VHYTLFDRFQSKTIIRKERKQEEMMTTAHWTILLVLIAIVYAPPPPPKPRSRQQEQGDEAHRKVLEELMVKDRQEPDSDGKEATLRSVPITRQQQRQETIQGLNRKALQRFMHKQGQTHAQVRNDSRRQEQLVVCPGQRH